MKLTIAKNGQASEVGTIAPGDDGVAQTIAVMQALVDHAVYMAEEKMAIARLAQTMFDASAGSVEKFASTLYDYCRRNVTFKADPDGVELIRTPGTVITQIIKQGKAQVDCDDLATFAAAVVVDDSSMFTSASAQVQTCSLTSLLLTRRRKRRKVNSAARANATKSGR
jgi:hypothetical protein